MLTSSSNGQTTASNFAVVVMFIVVMFSGVNVLAESSDSKIRIPPRTKLEFSELYKMTVSYYGSSRVCGDIATINEARNSMIRVRNFGVFHKFLRNDSERIEKAEVEAVKMSEKTYKKQRWVSCDQVGYYVRQIDKHTKRLP